MSTLLYLSLERLSEMFSLPLSVIHSIVSKMIIKEELLVSEQYADCMPVTSLS